ncbi:MAG TPA: MFS transporter [Verrucomicrobiae bacterium]|jgi:MFS family permease|nr:MFS transporter [Verrucomicrobiae bacterium]
MSDASGSLEQTDPLDLKPANDPYGVLKNRDFLLYLIGRFIASFGQQMLAVAVGWEIYERTNATMALGFVGLVQLIPMFLFTFPAGHVADNYNRKFVILWMQLVVAIACAGLAAVSFVQAPVMWMYACLFLFGGARTYLWAASASFMPQLVERHQFAKAVTWSSGSFQVSAVAGPAAGGALIALTHTAKWVYVINVVASILCALLIGMVRSHHKVAAKEPMSLQNVAAGLKFVYRTKIVLGSITLDLFAVLLGGASALLPVYARDILHVGPSGLGWLQGALPMGSLLMSIILVHRPPLQKAGRTLLWAVVGFGLATIVFGISKNFWLSFAMLFLCGATDYISVVVRHTLVQLLTPDEMRGRVSAVNSLFIGTSNQMGEFESGFVASYTSPLFAVVSGGVGTIIVVAIVAALWPEIRKYGRLA